jgi:hypothetical protein
MFAPSIDPLETPAARPERRSRRLRLLVLVALVVVGAESSLNSTTQQINESTPAPSELRLAAATETETENPDAQRFHSALDQLGEQMGQTIRRADEAIHSETRASGEESGTATREFTNRVEEATGQAQQALDRFGEHVGETVRRADEALHGGGARVGEAVREADRKIHSLTRKRSGQS